MIRGLWAAARLDILLWLRMPLYIMSSVIPPLGMALVLAALVISAGMQPVALVVESQSNDALLLTHLIMEDTEAYMLKLTDSLTAARMLRDQEVAAVITIPEDFDDSIDRGEARVILTLNNIDIDFADDIRRSVDRSVAQYDAPGMTYREEQSPIESFKAPNPYRISIDEHDLRRTNVGFFSYQIIPVLILIVLSVGFIGTSLLGALDKEKGTARYLVIAPVSSWAIIAGRILGSFIMSMAVLVPAIFICILTGVIDPPPDHWPALAVLFISTGLCASGLGAVLGSVIRDSRTAAMASASAAAGLFFLGGGFTTIVFLPLWLRNISAFIPIRYAIDGIRQALFYPVLDGIGKDIAVLLFSAAASVIAGSLLLRRSWTSE